MKKVLLHSCCAPCATHCILALRDLGYAVTLFYSNANLAPPAEYARRLDTLQHLARQLDVPLLIDITDHDDWLSQVAHGFESEPEKGARCPRCFRYSLERTQRAMQKHGFDFFTTTLSIGPHKASPLILELGRAISARFLALDFKKKDGFQHSIKLSKEYNLYRQSYCGCEFSLAARQQRLAKANPHP